MSLRLNRDGLLRGRDDFGLDEMRGVITEPKHEKAIPWILSLMV